MLRDQLEDHSLLVDNDAATDALPHPPDVRPPYGMPESGRPGEIEREAWLPAALEALPCAIRLLPHTERRLVVGRFYEQRPVDELALELRLTPAHATAMLGAALHTLRVKIGG